LSEGVGAMSGGRFDDCPAGAGSLGRPGTSHTMYFGASWWANDNSFSSCSISMCTIYWLFGIATV